jgi:hypothetical protein
VAHTCNPSSSGGRDQENQGLKREWANCKTLSQKKNITKMAGAVAQGIGPEFKSQYGKINK